MALKIAVFLSLVALAVAWPHMDFNIKEIEKIPKLIKTKDDVIDFVTERNYKDPNQKVKLTKFAYKDCGGSDALVNIESVTFGPDPVVLPGTLKISTSINVKKTLDTPLVGNVTIFKKIANKFVKLPCVGMIGSCHYDDLCDLLEEATCPDALEKIGINCLCPLFKPQKYTLPVTNFDVYFGPIPSGDYHIIGEADYKGQTGACIDLVLTFK